MPYVVSDDCIQCGACVTGCANGAITEGDTKSVIDPNLCVECGTCAENCPSGAITFVEEKDVEIPPAPLANSVRCPTRGGSNSSDLATPGETEGLAKGGDTEEKPAGE